MISLGDSHNFGKRVCLLKSGRIEKPRNVFWESLILGSSSLFRKKLDDLSQAKAIPSPVAFLPSLDVSPGANGLTHEGEVERLELLPPHPSAISTEVLEHMGATLALIAWLGINDLHNDNIVFGVNLEGRPIFGPIDIEGIFDDYYLLSQAHLLCSKELSVTDSGLLKLLNFMVEFPIKNGVAAFCSGYIKGLDFLLENEASLLSGVIQSADLAKIPTRVIIRPTREYYSILKTLKENGNQGLEPSEYEQLLRGDIPYYFRPLGSLDIMYFSNPETSITAGLPSEICKRATHHARLLLDASITPRKNGDLLRKVSTLQLARELIANSSSFDETFSDTCVRIEGGQVQILHQSPFGRALNVGCARRVQNA